MIPKNIRKEHIEKAIQEIDENGIEKGAHSSTYDVVYNGKRYPPKLVVSLANKYANGEILPRDTFKGGEDTEAFKLLERFRFEIVPKKEFMGKENVKNEFIEWLIKKPSVNYFYNDTDRISKELDKANTYFTLDIFEVNSSNYKAIKSLLLKVLYEESDNEFLKYSDKIQNHLPRAVLGKKNYFEFLEEKFSDIMLKGKSIYSWVKTHKQLSQYLLDKEGQQPVLIEILKQAGATLFNDEDPAGSKIELTEIDPFTFYCYIYKYGQETRLEILQNIAKSLNLFVPDDESGIPSTNAQKVWLFPYKYNRKNNEIERLWQFFYSALQNNISDEQFEDILNIRGVAHTKITEALFYVDPENYFPINGPTKPYLEEVLKINPNFTTYSEYKNILNQIKTKTDKPFYQLSHEAWLWNDEQKKDMDKDFSEYLKRFSHEDLCTYFSFLFETLDRFNIKPGDKRILYSTTNNNIAFTIGQRYSWVLHKSNKKGKFAVLSIDEIRPNSEEFTGNLPYPFYTYLDVIDFSSGDRASIFNGFDQELERTNKTSYRKHSNQEFESAVFESSFRKKYSKYRTMDNESKVLNKILFGPPGTGKTFNSINESLNIVDPDFYKENEGDRNKLNNRFKELLIKNWDNTNGQIAFCTFHQSFSYEDFVEGIKPKTNEKQEVFYEIEDGVFKRICQLADSSISAVKMKKEGKLSWAEEKFNKASFYKLSLGDSKKSEDKEIYNYCRDENYIAIGFGSDYDFSSMSETEIKDFCDNKDELSDTDAQQLNYFIHYLKVGNYVLISNGNKFVRALGRVVGDYEYDPNAPIRYNQFRKVEWVFTDENIPVEELYNRNFSQVTLYKIDEDGLKKDFFVNHGQNAQAETKKEKNYVLIIDEINRGNVSSIFGELITLIEPDKRSGENEELEVTLPYSKESFKVPHNVYIVGTMNTADRSIEALDTALRRRFSFKEMPPKPELIETEGNSGKTNGIADGINLSRLLQTMNNRIEKLIDKDHKIGHSYFLKVNNKESLVHCFENEVIPLLEEYFFGDYGKIGLVLGDSFVVKDETEAFEFAEFEGYDADVSSDLKERSVYKIRPSTEWDFKSI